MKEVLTQLFRTKKTNHVDKEAFVLVPVKLSPIAGVFHRKAYIEAHAHALVTFLENTRARAFCVSLTRARVCIQKPNKRNTSD